MKRLAIFTILTASLLAAQPAQAAIVLEFYQGTSENDTALSLVPFPGGTLTVMQGGPSAFVQVAMVQTPAGGGPLTPGDGLAAFLMQGLYGANQANSFMVPATNGLPTGTTPVVNVADPGTYSLVRTFRTGPTGGMPGGTSATATAMRFGGLNLNPPPSPSVDANGRIFLGTFQVDPNNSSGTPQNSSIIFQDPNPGAGTVDNVTDAAVNLDTILFNGNTYTLGITVQPVPEPTSLVLAGLVASGAIGLRLRRKKTAAETTQAV